MMRGCVLCLLANPLASVRFSARVLLSILRAMTSIPADPVLGGSWYLLTKYNCTSNCAYNHIGALKGLLSGF